MMDENFEVNELELENMSQVPPVDPQPEEVQPEAPQAPAAPVRKRRKKRRKRPTWQRLLWKYWPPIRFGLIILAGILLIWLVCSSIGAMFTPSEEPQPTDPPVTEAPTDPTEAPTLPPTEAPTAPPTEPPDLPVADSWFNNTLFIGDFNVAGLRDYARSGNADYFCTSNMGVFNWDEETASDDDFDDQDLLTLLGTKSYEKIIINMGINNCGWPTSSLINAYEDLVTTIQDAQPNAKIILHGILLVTEDYADGTDYFTPEHIGDVNQRIAALADGESVFYIDVNASFASTSGYLLSSVSSNGYMLTSASYADWANLMSIQLNKLGIN